MPALCWKISSNSFCSHHTRVFVIFHGPQQLSGAACDRLNWAAGSHITNHLAFFIDLVIWTGFHFLRWLCFLQDFVTSRSHPPCRSHRTPCSGTTLRRRSHKLWRILAEKNRDTTWHWHAIHTSLNIILYSYVCKNVFCQNTPPVSDAHVWHCCNNLKLLCGNHSSSSLISTSQIEAGVVRVEEGEATLGRWEVSTNCRQTVN